jgi:hypothetical protein
MDFAPLLKRPLKKILSVFFFHKQKSDYKGINMVYVDTLIIFKDDVLLMVYYPFFPPLSFIKPQQHNSTDGLHR